MKTSSLVYLLAGLGGYLGACGSLKTSKQQYRAQLAETETNGTALNQQLQHTATAQLLDTTNSEYTVQIIPLGAFTYSSGAGFAGRATAITVRGKTARKLQVNRQESLQVQVQQQSQQSVKTKVNTQSRAEAKTSPSWSRLGGLILLLVLLTGCGLIIKRRFFG